MPHNVNSMAYYGTPPWHGLGTRVYDRPDSTTMVKAAGLDWEVGKVPVPGRRVDDNGAPVRYQLMRKARPGTEECDIVLGIVSPKYEPLQNVEAFGFFDSIVGKGSAVYETAGALGDGERIWVLAKLPDQIVLSGDDIIDKYLLLSNEHTGSGSVAVKFTPIRVVCQNTLNLAIKDGQQVHRVRHSKNMFERLAEAEEVLGICKNVYKAAEASFMAMMQVQMKDDRLVIYLDAVLPRTELQKENGEKPQRWEPIFKLFESPDFTPRQARGTLWAAYNAITRYEDYRESREAGQDRRLDRVWFGRGADLKVRAFKKAEEFADSWS